MKNLHILIILLLLAFSSGCLTNANEQIERPKTVIGDQTGDASTDDGDYLYADGISIGVILAYGASIALEFDESFDAVEVLADGKIKTEDQILFSEPDCLGEAYARGDFSDYESTASFKLKRAKGKIFPCDATACGAPLYYLPPDEGKYYFVAPASGVYGQTCSNATGASEWYYYRVLPNDPTVTGIVEYPFPTPLTFDGMEDLLMKRAVL